MRRISFLGVIAGICGLLIVSSNVAQAVPHTVSLPLHDGKLQLADLTATLCDQWHLPAIRSGKTTVDLTSLKGTQYVAGLNDALGDACQIHIDGQSLVIRVDPAKLPHRMDDAKRAIRILTADLAPEAAANQAAHWGIFLPNDFDHRKPLVLVIHGLDSERADMGSLARLLEADGFQVGYFCYAGDQPIADSGRFFAREVKKLREKYPGIKLDIVAYSMGGLVARAFVEGNEFSGGVDHFIMVGTPNAGSTWADGQILLKAEQQYHDWKNDPQWHWTWAITDGLGEAARDLKPHSKFLDELNSRPRQAKVKYTIIAGNQSLTSQFSADIAQATVHAVPKATAKWWGVRQCEVAITHCGDHFRQKTGTTDGPVKIDSARLAGVSDVVIVPGDHATLVCSAHGNPPNAWPIIRDRLKDAK